MTNQMICKAFEVTLLPGAEDRMWRNIDEKLRDHGGKAQVRFRKRRSPLPMLLAAALAMAAALLMILLVRRFPENGNQESIAATTEPEETIMPTETPEPTKTPEERRQDRLQLDEEETLAENRLPDPRQHAHQWYWDSYNTIIASCVSPGYKYYICSVCGLRTKREYMGEHQYSYVNHGVNPLTGIGYHTKWCPVCGANFGMEEHQWVRVSNNSFVCSCCGAEISFG